MHHSSSSEMQDCIKNCLDCHWSCLQTATMCLQHGGQHAAAPRITLMHDCAQICLTAADFMLRQSPHHGHVCRICADVCDQCATECDRMASDMPDMRQCAEVCRRCAHSCRQMAA